MKPVFVRFRYGQEDRQSPDYGPYEFAQLTYDTLRVGFADGSDGDLARMNFDRLWQAPDGAYYSDVVIGVGTA